MAMDDLSKSILLQVAFKAATEKDYADNTELMRNADDFYSVLVALHEKHGVYDGEAVAPRRSGGGRQQQAVDAPTVTIDGVEYYDFRGIKAIDPEMNPNHPEFKRVSDGEGYWITKKDGSPTKFAQTVAAAGV